MQEHVGVPAGGRPGAMVQVDDPGDPRLADYRRLNDPAGRRSLEAERSIIVVEGRLAVDRLLESAYRVLSLLIDDRHLAAAAHLVESTLDRGAPVYVGTPEVVTATVGFALHRGVVAVARRPASVAAGDVLADIASSSGFGERPAVVAVLEGLNDHENIGALFRNAAAFGVSAVLMDPTCAPSGCPSATYCASRSPGCPPGRVDSTSCATPASCWPLWRRSPRMGSGPVPTHCGFPSCGPACRWGPGPPTKTEAVTASVDLAAWHSCSVPRVPGCPTRPVPQPM